MFSLFSERLNSTNPQLDKVAISPRGIEVISSALKLYEAMSFPFSQFKEVFQTLKLPEHNNTPLSLRCSFKPGELTTIHEDILKSPHLTPLQYAMMKRNPRAFLMLCDYQNGEVYGINHLSGPCFHNNHRISCLGLLLLSHGYFEKSHYGLPEDREAAVRAVNSIITKTDSTTYHHLFTNFSHRTNPDIIWMALSKLKPEISPNTDFFINYLYIVLLTQRSQAIEQTLVKFNNRTFLNFSLMKKNTSPYSLSIIGLEKLVHKFETHPQQVVILNELFAFVLKDIRNELDSYKLLIVPSGVAGDNRFSLTDHKNAINSFLETHQGDRDFSRCLLKNPVLHTLPYKRLISLHKACFQEYDKSYELCITHPRN